MRNDEWKKIDTLKIVDRSYAGRYYRLNYAQKNKNMKDLSSSCSGTFVNINESLKIRKLENGDIVYRTVGRDDNSEKPVLFETQFGTYTSDDHGEFGGTLTTPAGDVLNGNFKYVFDVANKVYALDTSAHLTMAHTYIYCFENANTYKCLYSVGGLEALLQMYEKNFYEELCCPAIDIHNNEAFVILVGHISKNTNKSEQINWSEGRILKLDSDGVQEIYRYTGDVYCGISDIIVDHNIVYLAEDKMIVRFDLISREIKYLTSLSEEDIQEIETAEELFNKHISNGI